MTDKNFSSFSAAKEGATNVKLKDVALIAAKSTLQASASKHPIQQASLVEYRGKLAGGLESFKSSNTGRNFVQYESEVWLEDDLPFDEEVILNMQEVIKE